MFGLFRFVLAMMVVYAHLVPFRGTEWNWCGPFAVYSFFGLSGYLMTRVLHERYGFTRAGLLRYVTNRALRIYPTYWIAMAAMLLIVVLAPSWPLPLNNLIRLPEATGDWPRHILLFGLHSAVVPVLVPPAWSLHVEVFFYVSMALLLSRSRVTILLWLVGSLAWAVANFDVSVAGRYASIAGASLPFSAGAAVYILGGRPRPWMMLAIVPFFLNIAFASVLWPRVYAEGFYAHVLLSTFVIAGLSTLDHKRMAAHWSEIDRVAGSLAYPIFVLHFPIAILVAGSILPPTPGNRMLFFLVNLPFLYASAWLLHRLVETPVERIRRRVADTAAPR